MGNPEVGIWATNEAGKGADVHVSPKQLPESSQLVVQKEDLQQRPLLQVDSRFVAEEASVATPVVESMVGARYVVPHCVEAEHREPAPLKAMHAATNVAGRPE